MNTTIAVSANNLCFIISYSAEDVRAGRIRDQSIQVEDLFHLTDDLTYIVWSFSLISGQNA
jgi:hypothetical protein